MPSGSRTATTSPPSRPPSRPRGGDGRPSLIAVRTHIGYGSPNKHDSQKAHGAPLGPEEVRLTKEAYGWDPDRSFFVPDAARDNFRSAIAAGEAFVADWEARFDAYRAAHPDEAAEFRRRMSRTGLPDGWDTDLKTYDTGTEIATRNASQDAIQALAPRLPGAVRRRRGPLGVEPDRHQGRTELQRRRGRPEPALRRPRTRHGRRHQRPRLPRRLPPLLRHVPDLQRLHARVRPAGRAVRDPRRLRLDPRFGRARRGRPDPPAGRALRGAPGDPEPLLRAARRRERDNRRVGARRRAHRRPGRARADPPEAPDAGRHGPSRPGGRRARRVHPARGLRAAPPS